MNVMPYTAFEIFSSQVFKTSAKFLSLKSRCTLVGQMQNFSVKCAKLTEILDYKLTNKHCLTSMI